LAIDSATLGSQGEALLIEAVKGKETTHLAHDGEVWSVAFSPEAGCWRPDPATGRRHQPLQLALCGPPRHGEPIRDAINRNA
jgi:hypothetical protein